VGYSSFGPFEGYWQKLVLPMAAPSQKNWPGELYPEEEEESP
jgi:hypothetical protein